MRFVDRFCACAMSFALASFVISPQPVMAQGAHRGISLMPPAVEQVGDGPSTIFAINNELLGIVDDLADSVVIVDKGGAFLGRLALPEGFLVNGTRVVGERVLLLSADRRSALSIPRTLTRDAVAGFAFGRGDRSPDLPGGKAERKSKTRIDLQLRTEPGEAPVRGRAAIVSVTGSPLASAREIGMDDQGRRYVQWAELVRDTPSVVVRVFVGRFGSAAELEAVAEVPVAEMSYAPADFLTITKGGELVVMMPTRNQVQLRMIPFQKLDAKNVLPDNRLLPLNQLKILQDRKGRSIGLRTHVLSALDGTGKPFVPGEMMAPFKKARLKEISRDDIVANGMAFLSLKWILSSANYEKAGVPNRCNKSAGEYWRRPYWITKAKVGKEMARVPYKWGGFDSPAGYAKRMARGDLAGDVCTCRSSSHNYCVVGYTAGVDCSGFVSRAWGLPAKKGTSTLGEVANMISGWRDDASLVKRGDALNRSGNHVRLILGVARSVDFAVDVVESTTAKTCINPSGVKVRCAGVCQCRRPMSDFSGYKLLRYKKVTD